MGYTSSKRDASTLEIFRNSTLKGTADIRMQMLGMCTKAHFQKVCLMAKGLSHIKTATHTKERYYMARNSGQECIASPMGRSTSAISTTTKVTAKAKSSIPILLTMMASGSWASSTVSGNSPGPMEKSTKGII